MDFFSEQYEPASAGPEPRRLDMPDFEFTNSLLEQTPTTEETLASLPRFSYRNTDVGDSATRALGAAMAAAADSDAQASRIWDEYRAGLPEAAPLNTVPPARTAGGARAGAPSPYDYLSRLPEKQVAFAAGRTENSEIGIRLRGFLRDLYGSDEAVAGALADRDAYAEKHGLDLTGSAWIPRYADDVRVIDSQNQDGSYKLGPGYAAFATPGTKMRGDERGSSSVIGVGIGGGTADGLSRFVPSEEDVERFGHEVSHALFNPFGDWFSRYLDERAPLPSIPPGTSVAEKYESGFPKWDIFYGASRENGAEYVPVAGQIQAFAVSRFGPGGRAATDEEAESLLGAIEGMDDKSSLPADVQRAIKAFKVPLYGPVFRERIKLTLPLVLSKNAADGNETTA